MNHSNNNNNFLHYHDPYSIDFTQHNNFPLEIGFNDWGHIPPPQQPPPTLFDPNNPYQHHQFGTSMGENTHQDILFSPTPEDIFNFNSSTMISQHDQDEQQQQRINPVQIGLYDDEEATGDAAGNQHNNVRAGHDEEDEFDEDDYDGNGENSSATPGTPSKPKVDRARTLISERRRRGRMKEKLYALRALVPNITKMDKASIVGDAVLYVQDLQTQAQTLRNEISVVESSLRTEVGNESAKRCHDSAASLVTVHKFITQMDVFQLTVDEYHVKISSNKGRGIARLLYKAIESLKDIVIPSSYLTTVADRLTLTLTLYVGEWQDVDSTRLKMWISAALLNQGFEFQTI